MNELCCMVNTLALCIICNSKYCYDHFLGLKREGDQAICARCQVPMLKTEDNEVIRAL